MLPSRAQAKPNDVGDAIEGSAMKNAVSHIEDSFKVLGSFIRARRVASSDPDMSHYAGCGKELKSASIRTEACTFNHSGRAAQLGAWGI